MDKKKGFIKGSSGDSPRVLPSFRGYTIDTKLREFRFLQFGEKSEFVPFDSEKGVALLQELFEVAGIDFNPLTGELESVPDVAR